MASKGIIQQFNLFEPGFQHRRTMHSGIAVKAENFSLNVSKAARMGSDANLNDQEDSNDTS